MRNFKIFIAEMIATAILVLFGCGVAIYGLGTSFNDNATAFGMNPVFIGLAFTLGVIALAYTVGYISGGHANPSVSIGQFVAGRISFIELIYYICGQLIGALLAGYFLFIASNMTRPNGLGATTLGEDTSFILGGLWEMFITFIFVTIILHVTSEKNNVKQPALIIAIALGLLVFISLPLTGGSLNAARSLGVAVFAGSKALEDLPVYLIAPAVGGLLAGLLYSIGDAEVVESDETVEEEVTA